MARVLSWFSTKHGKYFTRTCVGLAAFSSLAVQVAIYGPFQRKVQEVCQIYEYNKPKPISEKVQSLINEVFENSDLKEDEKKKIKFFNVVGQELWHFGGINSPWGALIGVPFYFEDQRKINFAALRLQGYENVDWVIEGQPLMEALTLSDNAKKFGLMREIYSCNIWNELDNAFILPFCILFPAEFARNMNSRMNTFQKWSLKNRFLFYIFCSAMGFMLYRLIKDPVKHIAAKKSDERAASVSPAYLEGGIEFYEHVLMRNKAIRVLLGELGERQYDKDGNENYVLIAPKLPTYKRIENLKKLQENPSS